MITTLLCLAQNFVGLENDEKSEQSTNERCSKRNAAANLQNANNELTAALEKAGEKIGDPLDRISAIGTFDNLEALDIGGGQNALLEEERRQNRFLERLESVVNRINSRLGDDYGEMV
ncbi:MAG: hypothetical protein IKX88_07340 [Thermoguttaceae bacterium]|nr:hypothetical protein [Thermoguttaceae bacterium]